MPDGLCYQTASDLRHKSLATFCYDFGNSNATDVRVCQPYVNVVTSEDKILFFPAVFFQGLLYPLNITVHILQCGMNT